MLLLLFVGAGFGTSVAYTKVIHPYIKAEASASAAK
jgi:hypothetical protein